MKTVLCFGDSLTHGRRPDGTLRHAHGDRWPVVLGRALGSGVEVVAEGLGGRLTAFDGPLGSCDRNGARILPTLLHSHAPIDLLAICLGVNDICNGELSAALSAKGTERLIEIARSYPYPSGGTAPTILIVSPPVVREAGEDRFPAAIIEQSARLAEAQRRMAERHGCAWFDAGTVAEASPLDGVHLDAANSRAIGEALAPVVARLLG